MPVSQSRVSVACVTAVARDAFSMAAPTEPNGVISASNTVAPPSAWPQAALAKQSATACVGHMEVAAFAVTEIVKKWRRKADRVGRTVVAIGASSKGAGSVRIKSMGTFARGTLHAPLDFFSILSSCTSINYMY